jgi:hypothetical protein
MTLGEGTIVNGAGFQGHSSGRWGDYSSMSIDPNDDCTFWYTQQYHVSQAFGNASWQTRVGSFRLSTCGSPPPTSTATPTPTRTLTPTPTQTPVPGDEHNFIPIIKDE